MTVKSSLPNDIRQAFKNTAIAFLSQLHSIAPPEAPYALLFEIADQTPGAWPIGATEESLTRMANEYFTKGYRARTGVSLLKLKNGLRWSAPGDDQRGWYLAQDDIDKELNRLIAAAFDQGVIHDHMTVRELCLEAIKQLDDAQAFGRDLDRNRILLGISNVDMEFENFVDILATVNPQVVIDRLRNELVMAEAAWEDIDSPYK